MRETTPLEAAAIQSPGEASSDLSGQESLRLKSDLQEHLPSQLVEAICNVTVEQASSVSPEPVRTAVHFWSTWSAVISTSHPGPG